MLYSTVFAQEEVVFPDESSSDVYRPATNILDEMEARRHRSFELFFFMLSIMPFHIAKY